MDERMKTLGLFALAGAALGAGVAIGAGIRVLTWGAAFGLGGGIALGLAAGVAQHQRRLGAPAPNFIG
jgi:hypothetical protein